MSAGRALLLFHRTFRSPRKGSSMRYPVIGALSSLKIHKVTKSPFGLASRLSSHPELINFIQNGAVHITFGPWTSSALI